MSKAYTKNEIINEIEKAIKEDSIACLYAKDEINYKGSEKPYTEEIIDYLYENNYIQNGKIEGIQTITRQASYFAASHSQLLNLVNKDSNRKEELFVKSLFFFNPFKQKLGNAIDYQTPLKNRQKHTHTVGKIDLITYNENTNEIFIVEVKADGSAETALRCCLEIQTYYQILDKNKFVKDFYDKGLIKSKTPKVRKAIIVFKDSNPEKEFSSHNRNNLKKLVKDFDIEICTINYSVNQVH